MSLHLDDADLMSSTFSARSEELGTGKASPSSLSVGNDNSARLSSSPGPLSLPSFVFPARESPPTPSSAPSSFSRATGRRALSAVQPGAAESGRSTALDDVNHRTPPPALPSFSFGIQSPPLSPSSPTSPVSPHSKSLPSRSGFHKRGTSEFIGGDGKSGSGLGLMSTSPTKGDGVLPSPTNQLPSGSGAGRRGHAHRRSLAISQDMSMILKSASANTMPRGGSAPTSPSRDEHGLSISPDLPEAQKSFSDIGTDADYMSRFPLPKPVHTNRARVGFSDDVQIIPRPLSLVSSDTSSTMTARQGHSVSGSISSVISAGAYSPQAKSKNNLSSPMSHQRGLDGRPRTAEPLVDRETVRPPDELSPRRRNSIPLLTETTTTTSNANPSTPRSARKWAFFGHELTSGESSPRSRPTSSASNKESKSMPVNSSSVPSPSPLDSDIPIASIEDPPSRRSSVSRKPSKKQKKVKSWAGSILSRKSRSRKQKSLSRKSPTPPLRMYQSIEASELNMEYADPKGQDKSNALETQTNFATWKPRHVTAHDEDAMSPIIDLDAALGPFNTPLGYDAAWELSQKGAGPKRRPMHSAAGKSGFVGPGMHYHRRAESAPEFENPRFALHRLGSSSTMGEVFEDIDEEDDEWQDEPRAASDKDTSSKLGDDEVHGLGIEVKVVDTESLHGEKAMEWTGDDSNKFQRGVKRKGSGLSEGERRQASSSAKSEHSTTSLVDEPILEEHGSPIEIVDDSAVPRPESRAQSSDSTATPPLRSRPAKDLDIQAFALQPPYPTPTSTTTQSFPQSPRSPYSYDTQRISTAPSSITEEYGGFQSLLLGEPGPELRMSVDDVPSLTSSTSTMTRDSGIHPGANNPQFRDGQRSASFSSAALSRKRSSMASLSRLISSSHGERSKLSIESRPSSSSEVEKKEKASKGKRISRMMQFWKPKSST